MTTTIFTMATLHRYKSYTDDNTTENGRYHKTQKRRREVHMRKKLKEYSTCVLECNVKQKHSSKHNANAKSKECAKLRRSAQDEKMYNELVTTT